MEDYSPKLKRLLKGNGCWVVRQGNGDHEIWVSPHSKTSFPVDAKIKSRHTANEVLKQAGLPK